MFSSAGNENASVTHGAGDKACHRTPNVPLCVDVDIVKHSVALPTDGAMAIWLAFDQHAGDAAGGGGRDLRASLDAEVGQHVDDGADIQCVAHRPMSDPKRAAPGGTVA